MERLLINGVTPDWQVKNEGTFRDIKIVIVNQMQRPHTSWRRKDQKMEMP
jgi:hypothetical protein